MALRSLNLNRCRYLAAIDPRVSKTAWLLLTITLFFIPLFGPPLVATVLHKHYGISVADAETALVCLLTFQLTAALVTSFWWFHAQV